MESKNDTQDQFAGTLLAIRLVMAALVKTHPAPEQLLHEIKSQMDSRAELEHRLADPVETALDEGLHEFTTLLYARISR